MAEPPSALRQIADLGYEYGSSGAFFAMVLTLLTTKTIDVTNLEAMGEVILGYVLLGLAAIFLAAKVLSVQWDKKHGPLQPPEAVKPPAPPQ